MKNIYLIYNLFQYEIQLYQFSLIFLDLKLLLCLLITLKTTQIISFTISLLINQFISLIYFIFILFYYFFEFFLLIILTNLKIYG